MPARRFQWSILLTQTGSLQLFQRRYQAVAVPKFNVVSVNELASMFEGGPIVRGDELM
jgi:hypothetical protein